MANSTYDPNDEARTLVSLKEKPKQGREVAAEIEALKEEILRENAATKEEVNENRRRLEKLEKQLELNKGKREGAESYAQTMAEERTHIARERDDIIQMSLEAEERHRKQVRLAVIKAEVDRAALEKDYQERLRIAREAHKKTVVAWGRKIKELEEENAKLTDENAFLRETIFSISACPVPKEEDSLFKCFSCKENYSPDGTDPGGCAFHPLPPVPPYVWHRWQDELISKYSNSEFGLYNYWPCCNTLSPKGRRPVGCRTGPHHQKWEMDVMMKRVMLSRDVLEEMDEFQEPTILNC